LAGDAAATDPICRFSPRHGIILEAIAAVERDNSPLIYRDLRSSKQLSMRLREPAAQHPLQYKSVSEDD
jgi:hypothetical protein